MYEIYNNLSDVKIATDEALMVDTETIGLYGKIALVQFYQKSWDKAILVKFPCPIELIGILQCTTCVFHNASYDISTIQDNLGKHPFVPKSFDDTMYLSRLYYYDKEKFSLDKCIEYATGNNPYDNLEESKKALQSSKWDGDLTEQQLTYAAYDVIYMQKLYDVVKEVKEDKSYKLDIVTLKGFLNMQCNGLPVDEDRRLARLSSNNITIDKIDMPINVNSYQQVRPYIGSELSDALGLAKLAAEGNTKAADVNTVRKLKKENSFLKKFEADKIFGKFAPSARSGRSTCKDQNLQQLPRSTKECFGVKPNSGKVLIYSDFSQLELRAIAAITKDRIMYNLLKDDQDLHGYTAKKIFKTTDFTKSQRTISKTCNFNLLYGGGHVVLQNILLKSYGISISEEEALNISKDWKKLYSDIKAWQDKGIAAWRRGQPWSTPLGRQYKAKMMTDQLNIQVQGMGAEVAKLANYYINLDFEKEAESDINFADWKKWQVNFIHDSYKFIVDDNVKLYTKVSKIIARNMQEAWFEMSANCKANDIPMPVQVFVGHNWGDIEADNSKYIYKYEI